MSTGAHARSSDRTAVLVVEDEPILRMHALDIVEEAGFEVVEATDATHAVAILESREDIRLVFSDIDMPRGIDGMRLAALVRHRWPPIAIILTSGYHDPPDVVLPVRSIFIPKPYRAEHVVAEMRRMIA